MFGLHIFSVFQDQNLTVMFIQTHTTSGQIASRVNLQFFETLFLIHALGKPFMVENVKAEQRYSVLNTEDFAYVIHHRPNVLLIWKALACYK